MINFFALYDALLEEIPPTPIISLCLGDFWTGVETEDALGLAMTTLGDTAPRTLPRWEGASTLAELAPGVKSWNFLEAGAGMAAVNACCNTPGRLARMNAGEPFDNYCTRGLDLRGKTVGVVGHLRMPESLRREAGRFFILERSPQPGDYPDSACDALLPGCDVVIITASTLVNKTLPHLLELCADAYTILAGPTCPLCPRLLDFGIDRLSGLVVTDRTAMLHRIRSNLPGPPYPTGQPFLLTKEGL